MSLSESATVTFSVRVTDPAAELFLINEDYAVVHRAVGSQTFEAAPGAYKVKARLGSSIWEKALLVHDGMKDVEVPHIEFASASPIEGTAWTHEHHLAAVEGAAQRPPDVIYGIGGSSIIVVARDWTEKTDSNRKSSFADPSRGLSICTFDGQSVADIEKSAQKDLGWEPVATCHVALPPGAYKLVLASPDLPRIEQTLIASPGWTTHVHLLMEEGGDDSVRHVDMATSAISVRKPPPWNVEELQLEDVARQALLDGRVVLNEFLKSRITGSVLPMTALYGAHLLIREAQQKHYEHKEDPEINEIDCRDAIAAAVDGLRTMLGDHPDVEAIALRTDRARADYQFSIPPMLRASWLLLLRESSQQFSLLPQGSHALGIAEWIWGDGAWLLWTAPDQSVDRSDFWRTRAAELLAEWDLPGIVAAPQSVEISAMQTPQIAEPSWLDSMKTYCSEAYQTVQSKLARPASMPFPDLEKAARKAVERTEINVTRARELLSDPQRRKSLVRQIGVPIKSINDWLDTLDRK